MGAPARRPPAPRSGDGRPRTAQGKRRGGARGRRTLRAARRSPPHSRLARRQAEEPHPGARARSALCAARRMRESRSARTSSSPLIISTIRRRPSLFRLLRGSGVGGLRGMAARVDARRRRRSRGRCSASPSASSIAYCEAEGVAFARDPSNEDPRYARTRLRALGGALGDRGPRRGGARAAGAPRRRRSRTRSQADGRRRSASRPDRDRRMRRGARCSPSRPRSCSGC